MSRRVIQERVEILKAMHTLMQHASNENIYWHWVTLGPPDEPDDDDFEYIAEDNENYNEVIDLFVRLVSDPDWR